MPSHIHVVFHCRDLGPISTPTCTYTTLPHTSCTCQFKTATMALNNSTQLFIDYNFMYKIYYFAVMRLSMHRGHYSTIRQLLHYTHIFNSNNSPLCCPLPIKTTGIFHFGHREACHHDFIITLIRLAEAQVPLSPFYPMRPSSRPMRPCSFILLKLQ